MLQSSPLPGLGLRFSQIFRIRTRSLEFLAYQRQDKVTPRALHAALQYVNWFSVLYVRLSKKLRALPKPYGVHAMA
jgi:hypothetical protein